MSDASSNAHPSSRKRKHRDTDDVGSENGVHDAKVSRVDTPNAYGLFSRSSANLSLLTALRPFSSRSFSAPRHSFAPVSPHLSVVRRPRLVLWALGARRHLVAECAIFCVDWVLRVVGAVSSST